jgi:LysM repeat protein
MGRRGWALLAVALAMVASCNSLAQSSDPPRTLPPIIAPQSTLPSTTPAVAPASTPTESTTLVDASTTVPATSSTVYASWSDVVAAEQSGVFRIIGTTCDGQLRFYRGTGFLIGPGLLVTAAHVVDGFRGFALNRIDNDPAEQSATLIGVDTAADVALLRTATGDGYQFSFQDTLPAAGADVGLIGYSGARAPVRPIRGTVNQTDLAIAAYGDNDQFHPAQVIEHDLQSNGGDSGAPLLDPVTGRVVGINVASDPKLVGIRYAVYPAPAEALVAQLAAAGGPVDECVDATPPTTTPTATVAPTTAAPTTVAPPPTTAGTPGSLRYSVVRGDTLFGIARAFNTTFAAIQAINDPAVIAIIHERDIIVLPAGARPLTPADVATIPYVVQSGDTVIAIAKANGTTPAEVLAINNKLNAPNDLKVGEHILIPKLH